MKAEMKFKNGKIVVVITDVIHGISREFGPFTFSEADAIVHDSDKSRALFLS